MKSVRRIAQPLVVLAALAAVTAPVVIPAASLFAADSVDEKERALRAELERIEREKKEVQAILSAKRGESQSI